MDDRPAEEAHVDGVACHSGSGVRGRPRGRRPRRAVDHEEPEARCGFI